MKRMPLLFVGLLVGTLITGRVSTEQVTNGGTGSSLPGSCVVGSIFVTTVNPALSICSAVNTWTTLPTSAGAGGGDPVPTGAILLVTSGSCPTGYAEETTLNGKLPLGTLTANGDLGTTGGSDTLTASGTVAWPVSVPTFSGSALGTHAHTFTGNALGTHAHELPFQIPSTTTTRQLAAATFGTGTSRAATGVSAAGVANTTSAAVALSQAVSAGTPAGTNSSVSAGTPVGTVAWPASVPTFTGSSGDNRSAFVKTLYCKKS